MQSSYTPVHDADCFPVDDHAARSTDCVSWGPHNILQVSTRWAIKLYSNSLVRHVREVVLRQHPLCYRSDLESPEYVLGAKWSPQLLAEGSYPACARLCVRTTANLVVYRITRHGAGGIAVSHGIGIGLGYHPNDLTRTADGDGPTAEESSQRKRRAPAKREAKKPLGKQSGRRRRRENSPTPSDSIAEGCTSSVSEEDRDSAAAGSSRGPSPAKMGKPGTAKAVPAFQPIWPDGAHAASKRGRNIPSGNTNPSSAQTSSGPSPAVGERTKPPGGKRTLEPALLQSWAHSIRETTRGAAPPVPTSRKPQPDWASDDTEILLTGSRRVQQTRGQTKAVPAAPASGPPVGMQRLNLVDYFWLSDDVLLYVTEQGLHVLDFQNDTADETEPAVHPVPPPIHAFSSDELGCFPTRPSCATHIQCDPGLAFTLQSTGVSAATAHGMFLVASPFFLRVFLVAARAATLVGCVEVPDLSSFPTCACAFLASVSSPEASVGSSGVTGDITVFLSTAEATVRGRISVDFTAVSQRRSQEAEVPLRTEWKPQVVYGASSGASEESCMLGFTVASLASFSLPSAHASARFMTSSPYLVLASSRHVLYALLPDNQQCIPLLRCPILAGSSELPPKAAVAVCGVAIHASFALSVVALQTGRYNHDPLHLLPVSANDVGSFLHRLLDYNGVFAGEEVAPPATGHKFTETELLNALLRRQRSSSFFLWEQLFPLNGQSTYLRPYAIGWQSLFAGNAESMIANSHLDDSIIRTNLRKQLGEVGQSIRDDYLQRRTEHGVQLFLRWPIPSDLSIRQADGDLRQQAWWGMLLGLWRRCPSDPTPLQECILSNAVVAIACHAKYANMSLQEGEAFSSPSDPSGTASPYTFSFHGALEYVRRYIEEMEDALQQLQSNSTTTPQLDHTGRAVLWSCSAPWVATLRDFIAATTHSSDVSVVHRFPCSICDAPGVATLGLSLRCTTQHVPHAGPLTAQPESHTTVFSGRTFSSLPFLSAEGVLTRCVGCGGCDFAVGPMCRICGGILQ